MAVTRQRQLIRKTSMPVPPAVPPRNPLNDDISPSDCLVECAQRVADWHINRGSPILAACSLLAVDDIESAIRALIRGHELELSVVVGQMLKGLKSLQASHRLIIENLINTAKRYLVYRAMKIKNSELALELAKSLLDEDERTLLIAEVVITQTGSTKERLAMQLQPGVSSPDENFSCPSPYEQVLNDLISSNVESGLHRGITILKESIIKKELNSTSVWRILRILQAVPLSSNDAVNVKTEQKASLLSLSAFYGAVKAATIGYQTVVLALLDHARLLVEKYNPIDLEFLRKEIIQIKARFEAADVILGYELTQVTSSWLDTGLTKMSGSHLPRHSDNHVCCITHRVIKGPGFFLEDDISILGLNDAFMWAKVHPFSPLGTGQRLNPF